MREFTTALDNRTAAEKKKTEAERENDAITTKHDGTEVKFYKPGTGQLGMMAAMSRRAMDLQVMGSFIAAFFNMCDDETSRYFEGRMWDATDPFDLESDGGLLDLFTELMEEWSGKDSNKSSTSAKSRSRAGTKSTANTRAKASTSSTSPSRAGSR